MVKWLNRSLYTRDMTGKTRKEAKKQVVLWLSMGWPRHQIADRLWDLYEATPIETGEIIREIRHEQTQDLAIDRQEFMAQQLTRLEALAVKAQNEGNLGVALAAFKEMHALIGLHAASR